MPFVFLVVGIGLVVVAIRGTQKDAFALLQSEFAGPNSFVKWALAIFILGGLGYIPVIRPITRAMLLLVILVIFLRNGTGLFAQFNQQVAAAGTTQVSGTATGSGGLFGGLTGGSGGGLANLFGGGTSGGSSGLTNLFGGSSGGSSGLTSGIGDAAILAE